MWTDSGMFRDEIDLLLAEHMTPRDDSASLRESYFNAGVMVLSLEYMRRPATRALLATIACAACRRLPVHDRDLPVHAACSSDGSGGSKGPSTYKFRDQDVRTPLHPEPETRDPRPETRDPRPETRDPRPETRDPRPEARNPKPETFTWFPPPAL